MWEDHRPRSGIWKGSRGGEVISFSGCDDHQTSADTSVSFRKSWVELFQKPYWLNILHVWKILLPLAYLEQALSKITSTGAMTFCFIQAIERGHGTTYGSILNSMRAAIRNVGNDGGSIGGGGGVVTSLVSMLLTGGSAITGGLRQVNSFP